MPRWISEGSWARRAGWLAGAALLLVPGLALAGSVYVWQTDDGGVAFSDDAKSIPARYRERAQRRQTGQLSDYERYTGQDARAMSHYEQGLALRLARLRELNAEPEPIAIAGLAARERQRISLRAGGDAASPTLELDPAERGGPVVMEWRRMKPRGQIVTRHNLVVRQGGETLAIVKGRIEGETGAAFNIEDEADFEAAAR